ncbi:MAG: helicase HerA domain-containing protein [Candidatus Hydrothermarchaeaceae archaeon]
MEIGVCIGEASPTEVTFISKTMPASGEYVTLEYDGKRVLGMIEGLVRGSPSISGDLLDPEVVERIVELEGEREQYVRGVIRLLGDEKELQLPRVPPPPGTRIMRADPRVLREIFGSGGIRIGRLISHPDVEVRLDANKMITRHLAVLAITGAGKSNAVSVIVEGILKLRGMPILFDMHSEYVSAGFTGVKRIAPKFNPIYLTFNEFRKLMNIDEKAYVQERFLREAFRVAEKRIRSGSFSLVDEMNAHLEAKMADEETMKSFSATEKNSLSGVLGKLEDFKDKYGGILDEHSPDILDSLEQDKANVIDLGGVDEDYADVIVSHVLRRLLWKRKRKEIPPAFCILEEAHILAPVYRSTLSKYWIDRIAREGRKFGVGLCLVSQRPKSLDQNSLSQANNAIIMRLVEPSDQRHVQQASERLSDDLLSQLPSLNVGEAVVVGLMTRVPAMVKIDRFQGELGGGDPDVLGEWKAASRSKKEGLKRAKKELRDLYGA